MIGLVIGLLLMLAAPAMAQQTVRIDIEGLDPESEFYQNVRSNLSLVRYRDDDMGESRLRRLHARAESEIRNALRPFGFYEPTVETELTREEDVWQARYRIDPGARVRVMSVDARVLGEGQSDGAFRRALAELPIRAGEPLDHRHYEAAKTRLLEIAGRRGYLDAEWVESVLRVDPFTRLATVELVLDSGPRYYFGDVDIQQTILNDDFVRRYLRFETGDPFDSDELVQLQYDLADSEYFDFVQVRPLRDQAGEDRRIPVEVETTRQPKHRYRASLGYGTDTGPRYGVRWDYRRINKRGHRGALAYNISDIRRALELRYIIPLENPFHERLTLDVNAIREDEGDFESRRREVGLSRSALWQGWHRTIFIRYEHERSIFGPDDERVSEVVVPGVNFSRTRADNPTLPRRGLDLFLDLRGAREELASDLNFFRANLRAKRVRPITENTRLLLRLELGGTESENFHRLPLSQRFFTGGDQSVRGFPYQSLSPTDSEGRNIGGRYLTVFSAEADWRVQGRWYAAAFVDTGNATMEFPGELETSAGIGVRWASPVGMIRLDLARPISDPIPERGWRLHLSVGPDL